MKDLEEKYVTVLDDFQRTVETSLDGKSWTNMGTATATTQYDDDTTFPIVFSSPVKCQYVRLSNIETFDTGDYPLFAISEIGAYE